MYIPNIRLLEQLPKAECKHQNGETRREPPHSARRLSANTTICLHEQSTAAVEQPTGPRPNDRPGWSTSAAHWYLWSDRSANHNHAIAHWPEPTGAANANVAVSQSGPRQGSKSLAKIDSSIVIGRFKLCQRRVFNPRPRWTGDNDLHAAARIEYPTQHPNPTRFANVPDIPTVQLSCPQGVSFGLFRRNHESKHFAQSPIALADKKAN